MGIHLVLLQIVCFPNANNTLLMQEWCQGPPRFGLDYSAPDWVHVHCKVPQLAIWEKQQHTLSSNHQNKEPKITLGEQGTHMSTIDVGQCAHSSSQCMCRSCSQAPGAEIVLLHSLCVKGCLCLLHNAWALSLCHQCLGRQQCREAPQLPASSHRSSLSPGKVFKQSVLWQISQKRAHCPAKQQDIPEQGSLYVCMCIYKSAYI